MRKDDPIFSLLGRIETNLVGNDLFIRDGFDFRGIGIFYAPGTLKDTRDAHRCQKVEVSNADFAQSKGISKLSERRSPCELQY